GLGRRFRIRGSIRPGRCPTLDWAIIENRQAQSVVAFSRLQSRIYAEVFDFDFCWRSAYLARRALAA
ncbi:MAG: hypothetical protein OEL91_05880, partial [Burkholderiaceae bacterium]|nr:hypothetical protein [Burkholderiaceae bacterium]